VFPFRDVILPWLVARLIVVPVLVFSVPGDRFHPGALLSMDGQWFRLIAVDGYDRAVGPAGWSEYPFFPLFPAVASPLMRLGVPDTVALAGIAWLASLVAFAGLYRLAVRHLDARSATWSVWVLALAPGALSLVLGYADAMFLAAVVWALVAADSQRWLVAGLLGMVATASRPNGAVIVLVLVVAVLVARASWQKLIVVALPSLAFLAGWMLYLERHAGDPLAFWKAKDAWTELAIWDFLADPGAAWLPVVHVTVFAVAAIAYALRVRTHPLPWTVLTALIVLPPMVLGVVGLARYAVLAFPIQFAIAQVLASRNRAWVLGYLAASAVVLAWFAHMVVAASWVP
jgi:Gpi18-like mannosyltransferase